MGSRKKPIEPDQIKRIHVLTNRMGISDEDYRARLRADYGADTCKRLSRTQAGELIKNMESIAKGMGIDVGARRRRREWSRRPGMATPAQLRKIEAMWADVSRQKTAGKRRKALGIFLERRFGVSALEFVTHEMPGKIIRTLEAMKQQARVSLFFLLAVWLAAAPASASGASEADLPAWRTCPPVTKAWRVSSFRCNVDGRQIILVVTEGGLKWIPAGKTGEKEGGNRE